MKTKLLLSTLTLLVCASLSFELHAARSGDVSRPVAHSVQQSDYAKARSILLEIKTRYRDRVFSSSSYFPSMRVTKPGSKLFKVIPQRNQDLSAHDAMTRLSKGMPIHIEPVATYKKFGFGRQLVTGLLGINVPEKKVQEKFRYGSVNDVTVSSIGEFLNWWETSPSGKALLSLNKASNDYLIKQQLMRLK